MRPAGARPAQAGGKGERFVTQAWYRVVSLGFGYVGAAVIVAIILLALRRHLADRALWRRVKRNLPQGGGAGVLRVLSAGNRKLSAGEEIPVPYEGTLGSAHSCDVRIPYRKVHMRSAFFWMEQGALHMVALHRDGFQADDVPVEPGDEAVLHDGAVLRVGDLKLVLRLGKLAARGKNDVDEPYVTTARRSKAQQGHGEGIGAPGKAEARREKRISDKQKKATQKKAAEKKTAEEKPKKAAQRKAAPKTAAQKKEAGESGPRRTRR